MANATVELQGFREQTRSWLEQNCPASMRGPAGTDAIAGHTSCWGGRKWVFASEDQRLWLTTVMENFLR